MSLSGILLAIWLVLLGLTWLTVITLELKFLGAWAAITGLVMLLEAWHPITVWRRQA